jgi:hypothetical protein
MAPHFSDSPAINGDIQVLKTESTGTVYGYRLVGANAGPQIVVAGHCDSAQQVFDRLIAIPTLPWMRGSLVFVRLDMLDDINADFDVLAPLGKVDRTLVLPLADDTNKERVVRAAYHDVLRACTELGMISGRGVRFLH